MLGCFPTANVIVKFGKTVYSYNGQGYHVLAYIFMAVFNSSFIVSNNDTAIGCEEYEYLSIFLTLILAVRDSMVYIEDC